MMESIAYLVNKNDTLFTLVNGCQYRQDFAYAITHHINRDALLIADIDQHLILPKDEILQIRLNEQLPVAEAIEKEMVKIRATHQDAVSMLLNYPQLTATRYFAEVTRLLNIPRFDE